jgi:hypothetical protein
MADRRTDETPLAPRRTLAGSGEGKPGTAKQTPNQGTNQSSNQGVNKGTSQTTGQGATKGTSQTTGQGANQPSRKPIAGRVTQKVSGAVSAATETVKKASEPRQTEERKPSKPAAPAAAARPAGSKPRVRKARLRMTHIDPWSVMKTAFLLSIALGIVTVIAVAMVWSVLGAAGVWDSINKTVQEVIGGDSGSTFDVEDYVGASRVLGFTMIVAVLDVVLLTAIATLGAFLYNLAATLLGGVEVTLAEEEH